MIPGVNGAREVRAAGGGPGRGAATPDREIPIGHSRIAGGCAGAKVAAGLPTLEDAVLPGLKSLLSHHALYTGLQRAVGADRLRFRCLDELDLRPGECVLDLGCGPAYYLDRLPSGVRYFG